MTTPPNDPLVRQAMSIARSLPPAWAVRTLAADLPADLWQQLSEKEGLNAAALAQARLWRQRGVRPDVEYRCTSSGKGCLLMAAWAASTAVVCYAPTVRTVRNRFSSVTGTPAGWNSTRAIEDSRIVKHPERGWALDYGASASESVTLACGHHWPTIRARRALADVKRAVETGRPLRRAV